MCELLVKAQDGLNGVWLRGRIVTIMPDGHVWGSKETPPDFYIVKVTGVTVDAALQYLELMWLGLAGGRPGTMCEILGVK